MFWYGRPYVGSIVAIVYEYVYTLLSFLTNVFNTIILFFPLLKKIFEVNFLE